MQANKHLLLWSSAGSLVVLVWAALTETIFAEWRQSQVHVAENLAGQPLDIQLRQIVVKELDATDRCISCHVGMAPGETGLPHDPVYGRHPAVVHEASEMGCTACHGGQGRATTRDDAHGNVAHWPEPMIPPRYFYAGCGSCHTHLEVPSQSSLEVGRRLFEQYDCLACHRIDGRGGTLRPGGAGGGEGPDISRIGTRGVPADWYDVHLRNRQLAAAGQPVGGLPWQVCFGEIPADHRGAIDAYLQSRIGAPGLLEAKALFHSLGCRGCHKENGVGGDDGPDLSFVGTKDPGQTDFRGVRGEKTVANWLAEHFRDPARVVPGSQMPALGLTEPQIELLTLYMLSLRRTAAPEALWPRDRVRALRLGGREFARDGATLYGTFCAACHGPAGEGRRYDPAAAPFPAIGNPDFLAVASDEFLVDTVTHGRPGRRMPAWGEKEGGLRPDEIREVVAFLRTLGGVRQEPDPKPRRWAKGDVAAGQRLFAASCASCHGPEGRGGEGLALRNPALLASATDTYLFETIRRGRRGTTMVAFGTGSPTQRALSPQEIEDLVTFLRTWEGKP
ncbi:MAG: c-type cytochrome [Planctomycetes bacterium]|nr:c-type cytochrome [Planctomycetota bacterium]